MRPSNKPPKAPPSFVVIAEGETEMWYFEMLRQNESAVRVAIRPQIPHKKKIEDQRELVQNHSEIYDKVFWIVDLDAILGDSKQVKKGKETPLDKFKKYAKEFESNKKVEIIVNNPCLEFWFLLHFEKTSKCFTRCDDVVMQLKLKTRLPGYEKTQRFFKKPDNDIYIKLKEKQQDARNHSKALGKFDCNEPERAMCEMESFFNLLDQQRGRN